MQLRLLDAARDRDAEPRKRVAFDPADRETAPDTAAHVGASVRDIAGPGYDANSGLLQVPGFTDAMRRNVPRSDGRQGYRPQDAPFGPNWVDENQFREYLIRRNNIYRF